ncbi:hypothetical protein [Paenibacillus aceris]|uniref:Uncharacterized protein n=1 Tax=Paenibacillus aceris TaxID=869555 RepID=A0ABS4HTA3_9BACL|nr:hypothetical protein [Paenibacillus aceris]MBP1961745.1 hypothetical protein [Paenibacillus aceris]NHW34398.1 hypothetical protein [Paenibacillus aceris]
MSLDSYQFANLGAHEHLLEDLRRLESRMKEELGSDVTLIAYEQGAKENNNK